VPLGFLYRRALRSPRPVLAAALLATALLGAGISRLEVRTDAHTLVPSSHPVVLRDAEIRRRFDVEDLLLVLVHREAADGVFHGPTLRRVQDLTAELAELDTLRPRDLLSLATERTDRERQGHYRFATLLDPFPDTAETIAALRRDLEEIELYTGNLVSADGRTAAILVGVPPGADREGIYRQVRALVDRRRPAGDATELHVAGAPAAEVLLAAEILQELGAPDALVGLPESPLVGDPGLLDRLRWQIGHRVGLAPLAVLGLGLVFLLAFRSLAATLLPLGEALAVLVAVFGLMGWTGFPVVITTSVLPVILVAIGVTDEVHLFSHYRRLLRERPGAPAAELVEETFAELTSPVVQTSLTSAVGFLSFLLSPIPAVRTFGAFAAAGIVFCLLWSLTAVPALLVLLPPERLLPRAFRHLPQRPFFAGLGRWIVRRPRRILAAGAALLAVAGAAAWRLDVQDSWVDGFSPYSELRAATGLANRQLHGTHQLLVAVEAATPGLSKPFLEPAVLREICALEALARAQQRLAVGGVLGPCAHLETLHFLAQGRRPGTRIVPDDRRRLAWLWDYFARVRGEYRRQEVVDPSFESALVTVLLEEANYRDTARLLEILESFAVERLEPLGLELRVAGDVAVSQALIESIVTTEVRSLALALLAVLAVTALLTGSLGRAALCLVPCASAVLADFGLMGGTGLHLGVATSLFPAMILGLGIDYAIHFTARYRRSLEAADGDRQRAVRSALETTGPGIVVDAAAICCGFGLLCLSLVPANARLGGLFVASVATCLVATLVWLPALLVATGRVAGRRHGDC
jgi:hypothetical protein